MKQAPRKPVIRQRIAALAIGTALGTSFAAAAQVSVQDASVLEGDSGTSNLNFTVQRSGAMTEDARITLETASGAVNPATAGTDYTALPSTVFTIPAGSSAVTVTIPVNGDTQPEADETLLLRATRAVTPVAFGLGGPTAFAAGNTPAGVASADLNGDGKADVAVVNASDDTVSVLRNTSSGGSTSFATAQSFSVGDLPRAVAIGDLNGDGLPDLVITNEGAPAHNPDDTISVLRNTSSGGSISFAPQVTFAVKNHPYAVEIVDLDGDGRLDIAVTNYYFSNVSVLRNTSSGGSISFDTQQEFPADLGPICMARGDVDGDGRIDLVVGNREGDSITVLRNTSTLGNLNFVASTLPAGDTPNGIAVADLDGNGKPEVIVVNQDADTFTVLPNNSSSGAVSFGSLQTRATGDAPIVIRAGDLNSDGKPDLVLIGNGQTEVRLNTTTVVGSITFAAVQNFATGLAAADLALADISGDSKSDLLLANNGGNTAVALINSPDTALTLDRPEATGTLLNDDLTVVEFALAADLTVAESAGAQSLALTLAPASTQPVTVNYSLSGTATAARDYTVPASVVFAPGETTKALILTVLDDTREDAAASETAVVTLTSATNAGLGTRLTRSVTLTDNDSAPTVQFSAAGTTVTEGASGNATLTLSSESEKTITVPYAIALGATATNGTDFTLTPATSVTISPLTTTATLSIAATDDTRDEDDTETALLTLGTPVNATAASTNQSFLISIADNDAPPAVSFVTATSGAFETSGALTVSLNLSGASDRSISVPFTRGGSADTSDVTSVSSSPLVFPAGSTGLSLQFTPVDDTLDEGNETLIFSLAAPPVINPGYSLGANPSHTVTIADNDVRISVANTTATEGNGGTVNAVFMVTLSAPTNDTVTVNIATAPGTASADVDYVSTAATLTFPPNVTTQTFTVPVIGDTLDEANETFTVRLSSPTNGLLGTSTATGTIADDDNGPVLSINSASVTEGDSGSAPANFTVTLSTVSGQIVRVNYLTAGGTATAGSDFLTASGTLVFNIGETSKTLPVSVLGDLTDEDTENYTLSLSSPVNASLNPDAITGLGTILDNDSAPGLSIDNVQVNEGNSGTAPARFSVRLNRASGRQVTVEYATAPGTATSGVDYTGSSGTVRFAPGETTQTLEIPIIGDLDDEPDETFTVNLSNPANASLLLASGTGTIRDNDVPPTVQFETAATSLGEASTTVNLTVLLSNAISDAVTVNYVLGTGTAGPQDSSVAAGTVVIPAGQRRGSISVPLLDDTLDENDETLILRLSSASGAVIGGVSEHTITIVDNDAPPTLQFLNSEDTISEGGQTLITLQLSAPSAKTITARLNTQGTATPGSDYTLGTQQFSFPPGETTLSTPLSALTDALSEADETAVLVFGTRSNVTLQGITQQTVTIVDTNVSQVMSEDSEGNAVKVTSERGTLSRVQRVETPATAPADARYPHGFFAIDLINLTPGETVDVVLTLPAAARPAFYVKCILDVCSRYAGAVITDNVVTLTLTDGGAGDSDGAVNGRISDPGAPAVAKSSGGGTTVTGGGGGGGAVNPLVLLGLLILAGVRFVSASRRENG